VNKKQRHSKIKRTVTTTKLKKGAVALCGANILYHNIGWTVKRNEKEKKNKQRHFSLSKK
jgi:hypothetical protein